MEKLLENYRTVQSETPLNGEDDIELNGLLDFSKD